MMFTPESGLAVFLLFRWRTYYGVVKMRSLKRLLAVLFLASGAPLVFAEGTYQMDAAHPQPLSVESLLFIHVDAPNKYIRAHMCRRGAAASDVRASIYSTTLNNGKYEKNVKLTDFYSWVGNIDCSSPMTDPLPATPAVGDQMQFQVPSAGVYAIDFSDMAIHIDFGRWDFSVVDNATDSVDPTANDGNLFSYKWRFFTHSFDEDAAASTKMYVLVPGGFANTNYVWALDLQKFSGNEYDVIANDIGLDSPNSGISAPAASATISEKYPTYLSYPKGANPDPAPSALQLPSLVDTFVFTDVDGNDNAISPDGDAIEETGSFSFTPDVSGTYAITIDINRDGDFGANDKLLLGTMEANTTSTVTWDGTDAAGDVVPQAQYNVKLELRVGEYHFVAQDAETSGGGTDDGLTILQAIDENTLQGTQVYWDDETLLSASSNLPNGVFSSTATSGSHRHTWGDFTSGGIGNETYIDTYVYGNGSEFIANAIVENKDAPEITSNGGGYEATILVDENTTAVTTVIATGGGGSYTYSLSEKDAARFNISSGGVLTFITAPDYETPTDDNGDNDYIVVVTVSDGSLETQQSLTVRVQEVNETPTATGQSVTTAEDTAKAIVLSGSDEDGSIASYSVTLSPGNGSLSGTAPNLTYTPNSNYNGNDSFTFTVTDEDGATSTSATVNITISADNDAPAATAQSVTTAEDNATSITLAGTDVDGTIASYAVATSPANGSLSGTAPNITYTPNGNFNGSDSFTFTVTDNDGETSTAGIVSVTVTSENDTPAASAQSLTTEEDNATGVTLSGTDIDGVIVSYSIISSTSNGSLSGIAPNLTYTPSAHFNGNDNFTFTVTDNEGATSATATISLTVTSVNDEPTANTQSVTTAEDNATSVTLSGSDIDGTIVSYAVATSPSSGVLSGSAPNLIYTPNADFNGNDSFTFTVTDNESATSTSATISLTVTSVNDEPTANAQTATTAEDNATSITLSGSDVDGTIASYAVATSPSNGVLSGTAPNLTYTPNADFNGNDSFTFTVTDNESATSTSATISLAVTSVNDAPTANAQSVTTAEDNATSITLAGSDVDGTIASYAVATSPSNGALSGTAPNLTYTPNADFNGSDSFTFTVTDNESATSTAATISLTVTSVNDAPTANAQSVTTSEDTAVALALSGSDIDGSIASYSLVSSPANGSVSGSAPNLTYTPANNFYGNDSFTFSVTDNQGSVSGTATVSLTVTSENDLPIAYDQTIDVVENIAQAITLTADDPENSGMTYTIVTNPGSGTLSGTAPSMNYSPAADYFGSDNFTFKVSDGNDDSNTAIITLNILEDLDGDGDPDVTDPDDDGDGISDAEEGTGDSDGDGIPDYRDTDSDDDGKSDEEEGTGDSDGDGTPDYLDTSIDEDYDGIPDIVEGTVDSDNDGLPDFLDYDSDNDGLVDGFEAGISGDDIDNDGIDDRYDVDLNSGVDANGDGIDDDAVLVDTDADNRADHVDVDSDNDGVPDAIEATLARNDSDNDGIADPYDNDLTSGADIDGDGIDDSFDIDFVGDFDADSDGISDAHLVEHDHDSDGKLDYLDLDSDNDSIIDGVEADVANIDADSDGIDDAFDIDYNAGNDTNNDGVVDGISLTNTDGDSVIDMHDLDSDDDGLIDTQEAPTTDVDENGLADAGAQLVSTPVDSDSDGVADYRDLDSDNDGTFDISDEVEALFDGDDDGQVDITVDGDSDGIDDSVDVMPGVFGTGKSNDEDDDGIPSAIDLDDDNDGIADVTEGNLDRDNDSIVDYLDRDSDNDGLSDSFESDRPAPSGLDADNDGIDDAWDVDQTGGSDVDNDGIDDLLVIADTDNDGLADYLDTDTDNDGIPDSVEQVLVELALVDSDVNGIDDAVDAAITQGADDNRDGIDDSTLNLDDVDGDGIHNFRDLDSDGDGLSDEEEGTGDADDDGIPNYLDPDSDNDGIDDGDENGDFNGDGINDRFQQEGAVETGVQGAGSLPLVGLIGLMMAALVRRRRNLGVVFLAIASMVTLNLNAEDAKECTGEEAFKESSCWYLGGGIGYSRLMPEHNNTAWRVSESNDQAIKLFTGFSFNEHWFAEFSYDDMGTAEMTNLNPAITDTLVIDYSAFGASVGYWLFDQKEEWNFYAKAGIAYLDTDEGPFVKQDYGTQLTFGGGVQWRFEENWFARFGIDAIDKDARAFGFSIARYFGGSEKIKPVKAAPVQVAPVVAPKPEPKPEPVNPDLDGDGVLNEHDQCPNTLTGTQVDSAGCPLPEKITLHIQFDTASAIIKESYLAEINAVVEKIKQYRNAKITVEGHTDWKGKQINNEPLSEARAAAVAEILKEKTGLSSKVFSVVGHGELKPVADNTTEEGRYKNRRVEISIDSESTTEN